MRGPVLVARILCPRRPRTGHRKPREDDRAGDECACRMNAGRALWQGDDCYPFLSWRFRAGRQPSPPDIIIITAIRMGVGWPSGATSGFT
jgi:hypothetical protein